MRLSSELRETLVKAIKKGIDINVVAKTFGVSRVTVWRWCKRAYHPRKEYFKDKPRKPKQSKITFDVELSILAMRTFFK